MEDFDENLEKIKTTRDLTRAAIQDLTCMADAMDEYIDIVSNPFRIIFSNTVSEDIKKATNKMQIYSLLANNKMQALNQYLNDRKGE